MTRCNLVPPSELADQHLFSEFRELKMIPKSLARSIRARGIPGVLAIIPPTYRLGKGHVSFFYNKGAYLHERYYKIKQELRLRGIRFNELSAFDPDGTMECNEFWRNWYPPEEALALIRARLAEKVAMKPNWYRWTPVISVTPSAIAAL